MDKISSAREGEGGARSGSGSGAGAGEAASRVTLLHNAVIVTVDPASHVFRDGGLVVAGDKIVAIGQSADVLREYAGQADEVVDLRGRFLLPGFINTHVHTSQQLARGIADDVDLMVWLHERIWPYESNMTEEDSYLSTLLCGIELIRSGVTCFAEAGGQHVTGMAKAVKLLGIRACLTQSTMDSGEGLPTNWTTNSTDDCIKSQKDLYMKHHNTADGRIRVWFGVRQVMNATEELLLETKDIAMKLKTGIHMHVAEIPYENQHVMSTRDVDHGTVTYLEKIGFLQSNLLAAHSVCVSDAEIGLLSNAGVKVSHCPASAMRMLGFAPIEEMLDSGICVSIGTDGAPSNNRMSIVDEMYLASLINKGRKAYVKGLIDPAAFPAETILRMATINGAKSVLWDDEIGSIEIGKKDILRWATTCYEKLFTSQDYVLDDDLLSVIPTLNTEDNNTFLLSKLDMEEVKSIIHSMDADSAPGPDGFNGHFFVSCWDIICDDILLAVQDFFKHNYLPRAYTSSFLVCIPKIDDPTSLSDLRPISLCNFSYKIIAKIMTDRLGTILPSIISPQQSAFVKGRTIFDNIGLASELFQELPMKCYGGNIILKLDMQKAYDRLEWAFLFAVLQKFGFSQLWINLIRTMLLVLCHA